MIRCHLANIRKSNGITQQQLSESLDLRTVSVSKMENSKIKEYSVDTLNKLCSYFNCSLSDLLEYIPDNETDRTERLQQTEDVLPDDEQKILKLYRAVKSNSGKDEAINIFEDALPDKRIECYQDKVSAGTGVDMSTPARDLIKIYKSKEARKADFAVVVEGESMSPRFHDGDILLVRSIENTDIETGDIGIFIVDGQTGFVKELGDGELISLNSEYDNIKFADHSDFICKGVVLGTAVLLD